ncbi:DUF6427 family protein [Labilibaculum antarcticum]|uniref:Beta-carotene 15,15'-monooxygenase n=1 Tax=Labilibaculum antarcticum TaxID=1717717 RepID=A0A1Y1CIB6_9BACT|nr:DUF6427 family protein [Labilibaculum antarcticum]BAX79823.1 hypothetical protein ALGA_1442 [Labilibaculum antarcticum]
MLLKTLKGRHSVLLILVPIIIVSLWMGAFLHPESLTAGQDQMPLYELLRFLTAGNDFILNLIACLLLVLMAYGMVRLNEQYIFIRQRTDLPAFVFAFIATGTIALGGMHPSLFAAFVLFLSVDRVFKIYQGTATLSNSFDVGFLIGLASLFYLFAGVYILWFLMTLAVFGYFRSKEILAGLMGFIVPIFLMFAWCFWNENLPEFLHTISKLFSFHNHLGAVSVFQYSYWGILGFLVVLSSLYMLNVYEEKKISSRKYFIVLLTFFLVSALSFLFFKGAGVEQYFISIIPVTYITSHYFVLQKHSWIGEVLFYILVISSILIRFIG